MTEVKIKQSRNGGSPLILAAIMLLVILAFRYGPLLGRISNIRDRQVDQQQQLDRIMKTDYGAIREVLEKGDAVQKALDSMPKRTKGEIPPSDDANKPPPE